MHTLLELEPEDDPVDRDTHPTQLAPPVATLTLPLSSAVLADDPSVKQPNAPLRNETEPPEDPAKEAPPPATHMLPPAPAATQTLASVEIIR
jgi:hypothetical protein